MGLDLERTTLDRVRGGPGRASAPAGRPSLFPSLSLFSLFTLSSLSLFSLFSLSLLSLYSLFSLENTASWENGSEELWGRG